MAGMRVSQKSLKEPDEFISFSSKLLQLAFLHKMKLYIVAGVVFGLMVVVAGTHYWFESIENKGSLLLARVMDRYAEASKDAGPEKAYDLVAQDFQKILEDYTGKTIGKYAGLMFAAISYQSGKIEKAVTLYSQAMDDFKAAPLVRNMAACGLGYAYEEQKEYKKASELFESLIDDPNVVMADEALFALARLYGRMNQSESRAKVLGKLADKHPESIYKPLAKEAFPG